MKKVPRKPESTNVPRPSLYFMYRVFMTSVLLGQTGPQHIRELNWNMSLPVKTVKHFLQIALLNEITKSLLYNIVSPSPEYETYFHLRVVKNIVMLPQTTTTTKKKKCF